jgi:hypothetical protein
MQTQTQPQIEHVPGNTVTASPRRIAARQFISSLSVCVSAFALIAGVAAQTIAPQISEPKIPTLNKGATSVDAPRKESAPSAVATVATDPWPVAEASTTKQETLEPPAATLPSDAASRAAAQAVTRWKFIADNKYDEAFNFFSPTSKTGYTPADLAKQWTQFMPKSARVHETTCSGEVCTITIFVDGSVRLPRVGFTQQIIPSVERWAWNGATFHLLRK